LNFKPHPSLHRSFYLLDHATENRYLKWLKNFKWLKITEQTLTIMSLKQRQKLVLVYRHLTN